MCVGLPVTSLFSVAYLVGCQPSFLPLRLLRKWQRNLPSTSPLSSGLLRSPRCSGLFVAYQFLVSFSSDTVILKARRLVGAFTPRDLLFFLWLLPCSFGVFKCSLIFLASHSVAKSSKQRIKYIIFCARQVKNLSWFLFYLPPHTSSVWCGDRNF